MLIDQVFTIACGNRIVDSLACDFNSIQSISSVCSLAFVVAAAAVPTGYKEKCFVCILFHIDSAANFGWGDNMQIL